MHRANTLAEHEAEAAGRVAELHAERDAKGGAAGVREVARATLAERTRERVEAETGDPAETRASETDPDARTMTMPDGGYRPAFDVPTATETTAGLITAVRVTAGASDNGLLEPMVTQSRAKTGVRPAAVLADAGSSSSRDVEVLEAARVKVFLPPKNARRELTEGKDPYAAKRRDSAAVKRWRKRQWTASGPGGRGDASAAEQPGGSSGSAAGVWRVRGRRCCGRRSRTT